MKFKRFFAVLLALVLCLQLLPVTAMAGTAYPVYMETVKDGVPLRYEMGSDKGVICRVSKKGSVIKFDHAQKHYYNAIQSNMWYVVDVEDEVTDSGKGGRYYIYEGNVTAHTHKMSGLDCVSRGCTYTERPTMTKVNSDEAYMIVVKENTPVRKEPYDTAEVAYRLRVPGENGENSVPNDAVHTIGEYKSSRGTYWYKLDDGNWVYSGNVRSTTPSELEAIINSIVAFIGGLIGGGSGGSSGGGSSGSTGGGTSGGGSSGGAVSSKSREQLMELAETFIACTTHKWSVGKCVNCGKMYDMTVAGYSGTFQTTAENVWAYELPYTNAKQAKLYPNKGALVSVNGVGSNALGEQWYRTSDGYWINMVQNVTLTGISLSEMNYNFSTIGATLKLKCAATPSNAAYTLKWRSDNEGVATVNSTGIVTAVGGGDATITCTATAHNGKTFTAQSKIKVAEVADYEVWDYDPFSIEEELMKECALYMCLAYPSYDYKVENGVAIPYIAREKTEGAYPQGLLKRLRNQGMSYQVYNYKYSSTNAVANEMTEENSPFVIAEKLVNYEGKATPVLYVIIEGSAEKPGWQGNMMVTGSSYNGSLTKYRYEHYTFSTSALDIEEELEEYIADRNYGTGVKPMVVITGHSRGGATGNLLAAHLNTRHDLVSSVYAYNFAVPNCTKNSNDSPNIFSICNETDMVCYIPLSTNWGYKKVGEVLTFDAAAQYAKRSLFTTYVNKIMQLSNYYGRTTPDYVHEFCTVRQLRDYVAGKWPSLSEYYSHTGYYKVCNDLQLFKYFYNNLALAACEDFGGIARLATHTHGIVGAFEDAKKSHCPYEPISCFFVESGQAKKETSASFADSHQAFTYYAAVLAKVYNTGSNASLLDITEYGNDNDVPLNAVEQEALVDFFLGEDANELAVVEAGWDMEDPTTWEGVLWDMDGHVVELDLSYMGFEGWLDLSELTALEKLNIDGNEISKLMVPDCTELKELSCFVNDLTALDVSGCENLESLNCALNCIEALGLDNSQLADLNCTGNLLTTLDLSGSPALETLRCSDNNLTTLDVDGLNSLSVMFCSDNRIIESENADLLSAMADIEEEGGTARMGTQQYNDEYSFNADELSNLQAFADLSLNRETLGWDEENPWSWTGVEWKIYDGEYRIASVNLDGMAVEGTLNLPETEYLETVSCENTGLSAVNLAGCGNLSSLNCANSGILDLTVSDCDDLTSLNCAGNALSVEETNESLNKWGLELQTGTISYANQSILKDESNFHPDELAVLWNFLNLGSNGETLGWDLERPGTWNGIIWTPDEDGEYYRVAGLDLAEQNVVGELDLRGFACLDTINLSGTDIETVYLPANLLILPEYAFYGSAIRELYLSEGLTVIEPYAFAYCEDLKVVALPESVARIGDGAFYGCSALRDVVFMGDAPLEAGEDVFAGTDPQFSITRFADTEWAVDDPLLTRYLSTAVTDDTVLLLDPSVTLYTDDTFGPLNQYCGHDITVTLVTRKDALEGACWLAVYNDQGRLVSTQLKQVAQGSGMALCTFDDVEIQYTGAESCSFKTFLVDPSAETGPISDSLDCVLTKPVAEEEA